MRNFSDDFKSFSGHSTVQYVLSTDFMWILRIMKRSSREGSALFPLLCSQQILAVHVTHLTMLIFNKEHFMVLSYFLLGPLS